MQDKSVYDKKREKMVLDESQWKVEFPVSGKHVDKKYVKPQNSGNIVGPSGGVVSRPSVGGVANSSPVIDTKDDTDNKKKKNIIVGIVFAAVIITILAIIFFA